MLSGALFFAFLLLSEFWDQRQDRVRLDGRSTLRQEIFSLGGLESHSDAWVFFFFASVLGGNERTWDKSRNKSSELLTGDVQTCC